jgi:hypothetical protein
MPNSEIQLDQLLRFIDKHSDGKLKPFFTEGDLQKLIEEEQPDLGNNQYPNQFYEVLRMLNKLIKDGYVASEQIIEYEIHRSHVTIPVIKGNKYYITYDGRCFEGYVKQKERRELKDAQTTSRENKLVLDSERLAIGTKYLWIATFVLALVEVLKWIQDAFCSHHL